MTYRLVATDMDGTMLPPSKLITPRVLAAARALQERGVHLVLSSARPPRSMWSFHEALGLTTPIIAGNGALIWAPGESKPLAHHPIPTEAALAVINAVREVAPDENLGMEMANRWHLDKMSPQIQAAVASGAVPVAPIVGDLEHWATESDRGVSKLYIRTERPVRQPITEALARLGMLESVYITASQHDFLEIMAAGVSKGAALRAVAAILGVPREQTVALGDEENDIPALQEAGLGIAVGNATEKVKLHAKRIANGHDADGWAEAIEQFVLSAV